MTDKPQKGKDKLQKQLSDIVESSNAQNVALRKILKQLSLEETGDKKTVKEPELSKPGRRNKTRSGLEKE